MLVVTARQEIKRIDEEIGKLLVRKAELQLYVDQMDAYFNKAVAETAKQMRDWWADYQKEKV